MYICVCHAISDEDVVSAEACGAKSETEVFRQFGVSPQCGQCLNSMRCMMKGRKESEEDKTSNKPFPSR